AGCGVTPSAFTGLAGHRGNVAGFAASRALKNAARFSANPAIPLKSVAGKAEELAERRVLQQPASPGAPARSSRWLPREPRLIAARPARALLSMPGAKRRRRSVGRETTALVPANRHGVMRMTRAVGRRRIRVSLCVIARDEAAGLGACLASAAPAVDEI